MSPPVAAMDRRSSPNTAQSVQVECHPKQPLPVTPLPASRYQAVSCDARKVTHIIAYDCAPRPCGISPVTFLEPAHYGFEPTAEPSCPLGTDPLVQLVLRVPRYRLVPYLSTLNLRRVRGVCSRPTDRNRLGNIPVTGLVRRYRTNYLVGRAPPLSMAYARVTHSTESRDTLFKSQTRGRSPCRLAGDWTTTYRTVPYVSNRSLYQLLYHPRTESVTRFHEPVRVSGLGQMARSELRISTSGGRRRALVHWGRSHASFSCPQVLVSAHSTDTVDTA